MKQIASGGDIVTLMEVLQEEAEGPLVGCMY